MTTEYQVIKADLARDRQAILKVWERNGVNTPEIEKHFSWAYEHNPFGQGPIFLLRHAPTQQIIGTAGLILRRMKIGDTIRLVGRAGGFAVDVGHRSLGPAILLEKALLNDLAHANIALIYTLAPPHAKAVFKRLRYGNMGTISCVRKLLRTPAHVEDRYRLLPQLARTSLTLLLDQLIRIRSAETLNCSTGRSILRIKEFDQRFDDFWQRAFANHTFTTERSSLFLGWRFNQNPKPKPFVCDALVSPQGSLHGYAISYLDSNQNVHVVDLFCEDRSHAVVELLMGLARRWRKQSVKVAYLSVFGNEEFYSTIGKAGWTREGAPETGYFDLFVSTGLEQCGGVDPQFFPWGFTMADDFHDFL